MRKGIRKINAKLNIRANKMGDETR